MRASHFHPHLKPPSRRAGCCVESHVGDRHNQGGHTGCARKFSFSFCLLTNSTMSHDHVCVIPHNIDPRQWTPPHRPTPPMPLKHRGAFSAPRLPFPRLSDPRKVARDTCTALARFIGHFWGHTLARVLYPQVFLNPLPVPTKTRARGRGYGAGYSGNPQGSRAESHKSSLSAYSPINIAAANAHGYR